MKNILLAILISTVPLFALSQTRTIEGFYNKYKNNDQVTHLKMQGWALRLASDHAEEKGASQILKKIKQLRVLSMEEKNLVPEKEYQQLIKSAQKNRFEELITLKEGSREVVFFIRQKGSLVTDVLILVNGLTEFVFLNLEGQLQFSDLNDLNFKIDGAEHFKKLPERRKDLPRA